jgi:hypothetical protein
VTDRSWPEEFDPELADFLTKNGWGIDRLWDEYGEDADRFTDAIDQAIDSIEETGGVSEDLIDYINAWLEELDIEPKDFWAELYA